ncbi:Stc1 domain-containing protein [Pseudoneurospora amorphoporcata]|uniref:Stc1 domain-containing protein n=1 Tax=Pseudoneurospora amorphoporcata TaxID=241081 RepID=A0AAN6P0U4_9PEZI|nr:Stc1 domain-containing protein [Pseudoneurospora amorphoporcata]
MLAPSVQSPALQARPGAASSAYSRGQPGQIRCTNGGEWQDRSAFNPKRLRVYDNERRTNKDITPYRSFISCKAHSGHNPTDQQCMGGCHRILPMEKFSKNSRRMRKFKCIDCTQHQLYLEPHATVPAPNTLLDTAEKEELAQARLRRKAKRDAAQAALDDSDEEDESLYRDDQSVLSGAYGAGSTVSGAITGSRSVYSSRYSEAGTGYSSQLQPPHLRSENGSATTSALAARLNQDGASLTGNAWDSQGFFSESYAAVSTSSNGYAPSDALLTDGQSTLGPEDSGSVVAAPEDDGENNNPPSSRRKLIADHTTVTEFFQAEEPWRTDIGTLSSGNWVKLPGRKTLPQVPQYIREGVDDYESDTYAYDGESDDEL